MAGGPGGGLIRSIQALYDGGAIAGLDDAGLLARYLDDGSHEAFEAIVARHGAMVYEVCRSLTGSAADADDAFQATFLVLACRAASVRRRGSLGPWLFGVARRTALRARKEAARRRDRERRAALLAPTVDAGPRVDDAVAVLIEEVDRLPARYREPVVLCHLQGLGYEEAASRLGCPSSTLGVRLKRAREKLRGRLERRGVEAPTIALPGATLPDALAAATSRLAPLVAPSLRGGVPVSVLFLTRGALRTMRMTRMIPIATALLALAAGAWAWNASASSDGAAPSGAELRARAVVPGKYRLTGRVMDSETGAPVAGATIQVADPGSPLVEAVSGRDGAYTLGLPTGDVGTRQLVPPPGFWVSGAPVEYTRLAVSDAHPEAKLDLKVTRGTPWEFRFSWAESGKPAPRAGAYASVPGGVARAFADEAGTAALGIPRGGGEATITIDSPGPMGWTAPRSVARIRWDDRFDPNTLRDVSRLGGNVARYWLTDRHGRAAMIEDPDGGRFSPRIEAGRLVVDVSLPEPTTDVLPEIVGAVVDREGAPVAGATVEMAYAWEREPGSTSSSRVLSDRCRATTDEQGRYRLADVPATWGGSRPTSVELTVSRTGFAPAGVEPVRLPAEGPVKMPDAVLGPGGSLIGTVVDPDRKPVVGARVVYYSSRTTTPIATRTDDEGRFRLDDLPMGRIWLDVRLGNLQGQGARLAPSREPEPIEIQLEPMPPLDPPNP
ncbi:sigma-70 family RNA polymerase sigma factor [Paludisphaera sp.]|uniref:sigma-70 family RNA polymerase sigma factor n=1 Tax=Paludisphaera sp. TaxID=2017432 RepID=UPI00301C2B63